MNNAYSDIDEVLNNLKQVFLSGWYEPTGRVLIQLDRATNKPKEAWTWHWGFLRSDLAFNSNLQEIMVNLEKYQQSGFASRKDVLNYLEMIMGKNTKFNVDFSTLKKRNAGIYRLYNTNWTVYAKNKFWVLYKDQANNVSSNFKTRKQAFEWLLKQGPIDKV